MLLAVGHLWILPQATQYPCNRQESPKVNIDEQFAKKVLRIIIPYILVTVD